MKNLKKEIKSTLQFGLLIGLTMAGAIVVYEQIWKSLKLPEEWWGLLACTLLGIFSALGLIHWITKN